MEKPDLTGEDEARVLSALNLRRAVKEGVDLSDPLWEAVTAWQGVTLKTSGRSEGGGVPYSYRIKTGRHGEPVGEILVDRKEQGKTITRSTVELALRNGLEEQKMEGCVRGPKRLKTFGASYLYPLFLEWGVIKKRNEDEDPPEL